jgi:glycosyltransferase involved in cell wall biosynthesis
MKIALFHTTLPGPGRKLGGVEVAVHRLAEALVAAGDDVSVLSVTPAPAGATYRHRRLFRRVPWLATFLPARWLLLPVLLNVVDFGDAEVLHLHGDDWFYVRRRRPTVRTMNGSALRESQHATSAALRAAYRCLHPLERLSARLATVTLGLGDDARRLFDAEAVVDLGVDMDRFHPGDKAATPTVLFVGTWEGRKRGRFAFDAFVADVLPRVPTARLQLVSDAGASHPAVEQLAFPSDDELAARYRSAWVFAYPSTYEGFGIPYVEALASGTAVVTTPNDGARSILDGGSFGVLVDDSGFGGAVANLLEHEDVRRDLEQRGLDRASRYAWPAVAADHRRHYEAAVERYRRARRR